MKTTYVYFGAKGYYQQAGVAPTSNVAALTATTIANSGLLLKTKANTVATNTLDYRVIVRGGDQVDDVRGTDYTTDFVTGELFNDPSTGDKNQDDKFIGSVTELTGTSAYIVDGSQVLTIGNNVSAGTAGTTATGFTMTTADKVFIEQTKSGFTVGNGATGIDGISGAYVYPMTNFLGANPVAYAGSHWDGTALDQTDLHFVNHDGTGTDDIIRVIHKHGKFVDVCKTFEAINNCGIYHKAVTFYDLDINGVETFLGGPSLSGDNDLGIVGLWRV